MVLSAFQVQTIQLIPFTRALESVLVHHKLSPGLLASHVLIEKLHNLEQQTQKHGLTLVSLNQMVLFQFPISFASFNDGVVKIVVHVPDTSHALQFDVFRFVVAPVLLHEVYFEILAVVADRTHFVALNTLSLLIALCFKAVKSALPTGRSSGRRPTRAYGASLLQIPPWCFETAGWLDRLLWRHRFT